MSDTVSTNEIPFRSSAIDEEMSDVQQMSIDLPIEQFGSSPHSFPLSSKIRNTRQINLKTTQCCCMVTEQNLSHDFLPSYQQYIYMIIDHSTLGTRV